MEEEYRNRIRQTLNEVVERLADELMLAPEAVADIAYLHLQKHAAWGRNPSKTQKRAAHRHWQGICRACDRPVEFGEAVFHHVQRRIPGQHEPPNLLPYHVECHDQHHSISQGSLSKGSPQASA